MKLFFTCLVGVCCTLVTLAQNTFPYNGIRPKDVTLDAFVNATIYIDYQTVVTNATLLVENGKIRACGQNIEVPKHAVIHECKGKFIYPSFIDLHTDYGMPKADGADAGRAKGANAGGEKGFKGWNQAIRTDARAALLFSQPQEGAKEWIDAGFGVVLTHRMDGIARGTSALMALGTTPQTALIKADAAAHFSFNKGSSSQQYPSSLMGAIALLRQTYYDAQWYKNGGVKEERNISLQALVDAEKLPQIFETSDKWNMLRADRIGDEFGVQYIFKGTGDEYQRLNDVKATGGGIVLPLEFPAAYDVSDPYLTRLISLEEMKHWEMAPANAAILQKAGIPISFTLHGLNEKKEFLALIRKCIANGLSEQEALKALTFQPASWLNALSDVGSLQDQRMANFFIASGNIFLEGSTIEEHWITGQANTVLPAPQAKRTGKYELAFNNLLWNLEVKEATGGKVKATALRKRSNSSELDTLTADVKISFESRQVSMVVTPDSLWKETGLLRLSGTCDSSQWVGKGQYMDGKWFDWQAKRLGDINIEPITEKKKTEQTFGSSLFPFVAYGSDNLPQHENVLIKNITIWTCEAEGKIKGDVCIRNGKIAAVGKVVDATLIKDCKVIDAEGLDWHVTPGIIDEHSHIALASVNEGTQASSAEVQEGSVIWPEDIDIYRQLSGGVTAAQLLHGSANPIGGQSALIKLRWGTTDKEMLIEGAPGFIKFALGENVKQSNWGDNATERFPQTRMGVEQVYYDHFIRAREYGEAWKAYAANQPAKGKKVSAKISVAPRRDLELDALHEILEKKRFITCHSYVQSEINMLMHVADSLGFTINTFTHILEGYKLADKMKAHGAGGSTFSDWWAYKMEVKDAIPYNAALMHEMGVTVAINSDDAEMARRLNQEAAKAVKYGGVSEEEALKMVTLNPAKLLHLDHRMGSVKVGKDADVVVWNAHPLSIYADVQYTYIDGKCFYSKEQNAKREAYINTERSRLINKMMEAKNGGEATQTPSAKHKRHFHCDTEDQSSITRLR